VASCLIGPGHPGHTGPPGGACRQPEKAAVQGARGETARGRSPEASGVEVKVSLGSGIALRIVHAASCHLARIEEANRAGSAAAYAIRKWPEAERLVSPDEPSVGELQLHTLGSIARFDARCLRSTGYLDDESCWDGDRPHREEFERERRALVPRSSASACAGAPRCAMVEVAGRPRIARTHLLNAGARREYVWFVGAVRVSLGFWLRAVDPTVEEKLDALAAEITVQVDAGR
jgi:hypothetical protein